VTSNPSEIKSAPNAVGFDSVKEDFIAIRDQTGDGPKVAIFNEQMPSEWVQADPETAKDLEGMR